MSIHHEFSYWLTVQGMYGPCRKFHEKLKEHGLVPDIFVQNADDSKVYIIDEHESEIKYEVDPIIGTTPEISDLPAIIEKIANELPELKITLECFDEEDQSCGTTHAYYDKMAEHDHARVVITSADELLDKLLKK